MLLEEAVGIRRESDFYLWTQGALQSFLPHETLVCMEPRTGGAGLTVTSRLALQEGGEALARKAATCLAGPVLARWDAGGRVPWAWSPASTDEALVDLLGPAARGPGLFHAVAPSLPTSGGLFLFLGLPHPAGVRECYFAVLLLPYLQAALAHIARPAAAARADAGLSVRQRQVLAGIRRGRSNAQIARELGLSPFTVKNHVRQLLRKLNASTRAEAVSQAGPAG